MAASVFPENLDKERHFYEAITYFDHYLVCRPSREVTGFYITSL